jgi:hypothetical protein
MLADPVAPSILARRLTSEGVWSSWTAADQVHAAA